MSTFSKFLNRYSGEISSIGTLALSLARGMGLDPQERRQIENTARGLQEASERIKESLSDVAKLTEIKISKAELKKAVEEMLPDIVADLVAAGVAKALEEMTKPNASDKAQ